MKDDDFSLEVSMKAYEKKNRNNHCSVRRIEERTKIKKCFNPLDNSVLIMYILYINNLNQPRRYHEKHGIY